MKKSVLLIGPFLFSMALQGGVKTLKGGVRSIQGGVKSLIVAEKPVTKTVQFSIFKQSAYSGKLYKQSKAKVFLSIWKCNGNNEEIVWSSTIDAGKLTNYPTEAKALFREITLHNIKERKETLIAGYKITYDSKGSKLSYERGNVVNIGDTVNTLKIPI